MVTRASQETLSSRVAPEVRDFIFAVVENYARQFDLRLRHLQSAIDAVAVSHSTDVSELRAAVSTLSVEFPRTKDQLVQRLRQLQNEEK